MPRPPAPDDAPPPFDDGDAPPLPEEAAPWEGKAPSERGVVTVGRPEAGSGTPQQTYQGNVGAHIVRPAPSERGANNAGAQCAPLQAPAEPVPRAPASVSWPALRARLEQVMSMADFCFVGNGDMVSGTAEGGVVTLWAHTDFIKGFIDKPDILKLVADTAGELAGRPCRAQVRVGQPPAAAPVSGDPLDALMGLENVTMT